LHCTPEANRIKTWQTENTMQVTKDTMVTYKMQYRGLKTTGKGGVLFLTMNFSEE